MFYLCWTNTLTISLFKHWPRQLKFLSDLQCSQPLQFRCTQTCHSSSWARWFLYFHQCSKRIAKLGLFVWLLVWLRRILWAHNWVMQNRFYANEIVDLVWVLHIPNPFITKTCSKFSTVEALCLLLASWCFKSAGDINNLVMMYQWPASMISEVVNKLLLWINERWGKLLGFDTEGILAPENWRPMYMQFMKLVHQFLLYGLFLTAQL